MSHPCCEPVRRDTAPAPRQQIGAADILAHAASPVFGAMAATIWLLGTDPALVLCMGSPATFVAGMPAMYLLMAAFHAGPWLRKAGRIAAG